MTAVIVIVAIVGVAFGASVGQATVAASDVTNWISSFPGAEEILTQLTQLIDDSAENSTKCELQLNALWQSLAGGTQLWALQMLDAWSKLPAGILEGNTIDLGNYDQCHKVTHDTGNETIGQIYGRYCQITVPLNLSSLTNGRQFPTSSRSNSLALQLGTCFPATCAANQLKALFNASASGLINLPEITITCESPAPNLGPKEVAAIVIFCIIFALLLISTLYEVTTMMGSRVPNRNWAMFSIYSNGVKLLSMSKRQTPRGQSAVKTGQIDCLNGIRVISMVWIVFCHTYMTILFGPTVNKTAILEWIKSYHSMLVVSGTVAVDSFFLLSGLLVCWSLLKELDKYQKLNLPMMYLHRYLRLTPALAALILLSSTLMKYFGSGPLWDTTVSLMEDNCHAYWWSALLYVQNYVNPMKMCLGHSWYLSVDMQLFVLSPLLIYPLWRWGRRVLYIIPVLILLSMGCVVGSFLANDIRLAFVDSAKQTEDKNRMVLVYYPTHIRAGAWLVGVIVGYILHQTKHRRIHLSKLTFISGWIISLTIMIAILLGDYPLQQPETYADHPVIVDAVYESTNRVVWAGCLAWIVFACVNGYGGPVDTFLSLSIWQPLGRLSYSIYLLHLPLQTMLLGSVRSAGYFSDILAAHHFWGDFGLTVTLSIVWCMAFESPMVGLEKLLVRILTKPKSEKTVLVDEENKTEEQVNGSTDTLAPVSREQV